VLVRFLDGDDEFILEGSLEKVEGDALRPYTLIKQGRYGNVNALRGAITYYRLSGRLANLIYSLNTTNTEFYAYQFKPVLHFLDSPCRGLLIADEVGLGKTIEAGLIWTELRARMDARRLLVLCPAMLREKWQDELNNRFGIRADICDAKDLLWRLKQGEKHGQNEFAIIASQQGLRPPKKWEDGEKSGNAAAQLASYLRSKELDEPLFDLIIVDEAHYLSNPRTQTHKLGRLLRPVCENLLLLSATPIQLRSDDLFYLLNLLDEDAFPFVHSFDETIEANAPVVQLRDRLLRESITRETFLQAINEALVHRIFQDNAQLKHFASHPPTDEELATPQGRSRVADRLDRVNPLAKVIIRTRKRDVQEMRVIRHASAVKASMTPVEEDFYHAVTNGVREFCEGMDISSGFLLTIPQRQMASCMPAACRAWLEKLDQEARAEDVYETVYEAFGSSVSESMVNKNEGFGTLLAQLISIAQKIGEFNQLKNNDTKYERFRSHLLNYWRENPGKKVVLFSFYRETLRYLRERLEEDGVPAIIVQGGMDKHEAIRKFAESQGPDILLSTEVAAEGVDLQFSSLLINYDLPWNPMRIEQRIGRIDRIGQEAERILIWNFLYEGSIDERIYERLLARLNIFKQALGSIEAILGDQIRTLGYELLSHKLTPEEEAERIDQTALAIETMNRTTEQLERDATKLIAHGDYIQNQVKAAQEIGRYVSGEDLFVYIHDYLLSQYEGTRFVQIGDTERLYEVELSVKAKIDFRQFLERHELQGKTRILAHAKPRLLFENRAAVSRYDIEVISQYHPLVRFVSESLKARGRSGGYFPVTATRISRLHAGRVAEGIYVYAVARWSVSGARDIERLEYCVINRDTGEWLDSVLAESLVNLAGMEGRDWPGAATVLEHGNIAQLYDRCVESLEEGFEIFKGDIERENNDRIQLMINTLKRHRKNQRDKFLARIREAEESGSEQKKRMIPAIRGQIKKLDRKIDEKIVYLRERQVIEACYSNVSGGVILVD